MIVAENLTKKYGHNTAIRDVSFQISKGEVVGFLGPNGAGKTTTMKILTCFLPADEGRAAIAGYDVAEQSLEVRRCIGYLPENAPLYTDMDVADYLVFVARMRGLNASDAGKRCSEMARLCGLRRVLRQNIGTLSKGYRQRVGLAQTLIHDPQILILDEPTTGLDPSQIIEIRSLIKTIGQEKTVILCSHILPEVSATCDRVLIINEGRIVADDTPRELSGKAQGEETVHISVRRAVKDEVSRALREMEGVKCFEMVGDSDGVCRCRLKTVRGEDLCAALFRLAVDKGWVLTELRLESLSLEEIFLKLTGGEKSGV